MVYTYCTLLHKTPWARRVSVVQLAPRHSIARYKNPRADVMLLPAPCSSQDTWTERHSPSFLRTGVLAKGGASMHTIDELAFFKTISETSERHSAVLCWCWRALTLCHHQPALPFEFLPCQISLGSWYIIGFLLKWHRSMKVCWSLKILNTVTLFGWTLLACLSVINITWTDDVIFKQLDAKGFRPCLNTYSQQKMSLSVSVFKTRYFYSAVLMFHTS